MNAVGDSWSPAGDAGQTQAEYALLLAGVFLLAAAAVVALGPSVSQLFQDAVDALA
ncbi:MAG: Flp family type IVb pilin [Dehalococcoidia bacterium]